MRTRLFALLFCTLLLLTACASTPAPAGSGSGDVSVPEGSGSASQELVPAYFGDWEVTTCLGTAPVCAMSQEEMDACVGLTVSYEADKFTAEGITCEFQPGTAYAEDIVTAENFAAACRTELSDLGVPASMLVHVTVDIQGDIGQNRLLGRDFFILDSNSLLIYCDGAFFQAERMSV